MEIKTLTNEKLKAKFTSQFELVNYAIRLAENIIHTGRGPRIRMDTDSVAQQVVGEIQAGKDQLVEFVYQGEIERPDPYAHFSTLQITEEDFLDASDEFDEDEMEVVEKAPKKVRKGKKASAE